MNPPATFFYTGSNPGADTNDYTIFDSNADNVFKSGGFLLHGFKRCLLRMDWDTTEAMDLKVYYYARNSTTAVQFSTTETITITLPVTAERDVLIEGFWGFKVVLTNDGAAKTKFNVSGTFGYDRAVAA